MTSRGGWSEKSGNPWPADPGALGVGGGGGGGHHGGADHRRADASCVRDRYRMAEITPSR